MSEGGAVDTAIRSNARWETLARRAAQRSDAGEDFTEIRQLLTFVLAGAPYAVPVEHVREIVRIRPITPVPRIAEDVRGVISLRGQIIQVIDLRRRLGLQEKQLTRSSRIIVVHGAEERMAGVLVDGVTEVLRVPEAELRAATGAEGGAVEALCVRGEQFVSLIDLMRVLDIHAEH